MVYSEMRWWANRSTGLEVEERQSLAISAEERVNHSHVFFGSTFHEHSSGTISEEGASAAVLIVNHRRHLVCANHYNLFVAARLNHRGSHVQRIEESTAGSPEVKSECIFESEFAKHYGSSRRKFIISCRSGHDDSVDRIRVSTCFAHELLCSLACHIGCAQSLF